MPAEELAGLTILVVEDTYLVAEHLCDLLKQHGATVLGPAPRVARALSLLEPKPPLDGAILDVNLAGELCYPIAEALKRQGVPFFFLTGYDEAAILPPALAGATCLAKPVDETSLVAATRAFVRS